MSRQAYPAEAAAPGTPKFRRVNRVLPGDRPHCPQSQPPTNKAELILAAISAASTKLSQKRVHPAEDRRHHEQQARARAAAEARLSEEEVLSVLECPVCLEYMEAPIHMCANGHNVCAGCLPRCRGACPSCRGPLSASSAPRNLALERLAASAAGGPCRNAFAGCPERRLRSSERAAHEASCPFEPLPCALGCGWRCADASQMRAHLLAAHARCATAVPDRDAAGRPLTAVQLAVSQAGCFRGADHAFFAFGHAFAYVQRFSVERRRLALAVRFFGAAADARRFRYELCLQKGGDAEDYECTTLSRAVHHWSKDLATLIEMKRCIVVDFETLVSFGKGTRTFKIVKIPEKSQGAEERGVYHTELEPNIKVNTPLFELSM